MSRAIVYPHLTTKATQKESSMQSSKNINWRDFESFAPWATIFAVLFTLMQGIVHVVDVDKLSFDAYTTQIVAVWSFMAVGRGLAVKEDEIDQHAILRFLNGFPWATVVVAIVAVVGYIDVISGGTDSLTFTELGTKLAILVGALGLGRGLATLKKDTTFRAPMLTGSGVPHDIEVPITDENVGALSAQAGVHDVGLAHAESASEDEGMGADDEPGPIKSPPSGA